MQKPPRLSLHRDAPQVSAGVVTWRFDEGPWRIRFVGRGAPERGELGARGFLADRTAEAWARQVHSTRWATARPGDCGQVDALRVEGAGVVATIATADCVPVVVVRGGRAMAIHAGWRGIVAGIVPDAVGALKHPDGTGPARAWIGPAIAGCCYEVGHDVADALVQESDESIRHLGPNGRPHVDLRLAVVRQLESCGFDEIDLVDLCTHCREEWLWSYRRDGAGAGRNLTLLWREEATAH